MEFKDIHDLIKRQKTEEQKNGEIHEGSFIIEWTKNKNSDKKEDFKESVIRKIEENRLVLNRIYNEINRETRKGLGQPEGELPTLKENDIDWNQTFALENQKEAKEQAIKMIKFKVKVTVKDYMCYYSERCQRIEEIRFQKHKDVGKHYTPLVYPDTEKLPKFPS